jgi:predicted adenylyl cyclase CyaB
VREQVARNVEIKARIASIDAVLPRARRLADGEPRSIAQDDTFYRVPHGRLKLREIVGGGAELIHYERPDTAQAKLSDYQRLAVSDAVAMRALLQRALGAVGRVRKQRLLLLVGQTRIHLDRVDPLGDFIELEVVLRDGQSVADGVAIADALMHQLGLAQAERIAGAYLDLLAGTS